MKGTWRSKDRLIIQDCTFVVDFQEGDFSKWDERRCALFVKGYNEVLIRNCVFIVKGRPSEPVRRTMASVGIYDTLNVQIEDCYFEGLTNWMRGHVTIFESGAVTIRRVEVSGSKLGDQYWCGGGLWIANGLGEGKLGSAQDEANRIYPSGPLLIEDCYVHDQQGQENSDGIYIQSIHPYLVRNCKIENWGKDGLMDLGFRDSASRNFDQKPLANHGAIGIVENCDFANGYVKCSVGLGGGLIFRNNHLRNVWLYPYVFDGGSWYVLNNRWTEQKSVLLSGRDNQLDGWSAKEGMLVNGSKMFWLGNVISGSGDKPLYVSSAAAPSNLAATVFADYNVYNLLKTPAAWALDPAQKTEYKAFADWQRGDKDQNSVLGGEPALRPQNPVVLPGNVAMNWDAATGALQPVGMGDKATLERAHQLSRQWSEEFAGQYKKIEIESLPILEKSAQATKEERAWASGGAYLTFKGQQAGDTVSFGLNLPQGGRFFVSTQPAIDARGGLYQLSVNGEKIGLPAELTRRGSIAHGHAWFKSGDNVLTYTLVGKAKGNEASLDALLLKDSSLFEAEKGNSK